MGLLVNLRPLLSHPLYGSMLQSITQLLFGDAHLIVGHTQVSATPIQDISKTDENSGSEVDR
jgi:hypothetical protein